MDIKRVWMNLDRGERIKEKMLEDEKRSSKLCWRIQ